MAKAWIKIDLTLRDKREVLALSELLGIEIDSVVGKLTRFWSWADRETADGRIDGATPSDVDNAVSLPGFSAALSHARVGWLEIGDGYVTIPRFHEHNGSSAKRRAEESERKQTSRNCPQNVRIKSGQSADKVRTKCALEEEEEREEEEETVHPKGEPKGATNKKTAPAPAPDAMRNSGGCGGGMSRVGSGAGAGAVFLNIAEGKDGKDRFGEISKFVFRHKTVEASRLFASITLAIVKPGATERDANDVFALATHLRGKSDDPAKWMEKMRWCYAQAVLKSETGGKYGSWRQAVTKEFGAWSVGTKRC